MIEASLIALAVHLWQSTLFAAALCGLALLLRRHSARVRYVLWLAASIKFLVPLALLTFIGTQILWHVVPDPADPPGVIWIAGEITAPQTVLRVMGGTVTRDPSSGTVALILVFWAAGTLVVVTRWQWRRVRQALRASTPSCLPFVVPVRSCALQLEPGVVGILRPVLMLPQGVEKRLSAEELRAVLEHERCHVAWRDNLAAACHMLTEALFWFHPLVWWLGARLMEERERACDEDVLARKHTPENYAEGILKVCEFCLAVRLPCVSGLGRASLRRRIEEIVQNRLIERMSRARLMAVLALTGLTAVTPVAVGSFIALPARANTQLATTGASDFKSFDVRSKLMGERRGCRMHTGLDREIRVTDCTLPDLVAVAYGVSSSQVVTGQWHADTAFDISAKVPRGVELGEFEAFFSWWQGNLRELLAQRLGVVIKSERRQVDGYALEVSAHGSKLRRTGRNFFVNPHVLVGPGSIDMFDFPPNALAGVLSNVLGAPVADQTGLQGSYDYQLRWVQSASAKSVDPAALTKSVAEQLGLRIEARPVTVEMVSVMSVKPWRESVSGRNGDT